MAKTKISEYDATAGNNTDIDSISLAEGVMIPSDVNNALRELMAHLKDFSDGTEAVTSPQMGGLTVTGTVTTDTIAENTSAAGVTIDGVLLKDGGVDINGNELILDADGDTSITADTDDQIDFKTGGSDRMVIDSSGNVSLSNGKFLQFKDSGGTARDVITIDAFNGLNINSAGGGSAAPIVFKENGSEIARFDSSGNLGIGTTSPSTKLHVVGGFNATSSVQSLGVYNNTTGTGANLVVDSGGGFARSTSSQRYKNTINDATHGLTELLTLRPVTYKHTNDGDTIYGGLIAEEVHTAGLTEFVQYSQDDNVDDQPEALYYGNMVSLCIKAIQEQQETITALEARIAALEAN